MVPEFGAVVQIPIQEARLERTKALNAPWFGDMTVIPFVQNWDSREGVCHGRGFLFAVLANIGFKLAQIKKKST
jgi:hypothetical protein